MISMVGKSGDCRLVRGPTLAFGHGQPIWRRDFNASPLLWSVLNADDELNPNQLVNHCQMAMDNWERSGRVRFAMTRDGNAADIRISFDQIDSSGGILAYATFPTPDQQPSEQVYDLANIHRARNEPIRPGTVDFLGLVQHETGHTLGGEHIEGPPPPALLNPHYSESVLDLTERDLRILETLGYPPIPDIPAPFPQPDGGDTVFSDVLDELIDYLFQFLPEGRFRALAEAVLKSLEDGRITPMEWFGIFRALLSARRNAEQAERAFYSVTAGREGLAIMAEPRSAEAHELRIRLINALRHVDGQPQIQPLLGSSTVEVRATSA